MGLEKRGDDGGKTGGRGGDNCCQDLIWERIINAE